MPTPNLYLCDGVVISAYTRQGARNEYAEQFRNDPENVTPIHIRPMNGDH